MSKHRIINLFDKIFISSAIFLIIFAWVNFYIRSLWTTFILSLIFSFACCFLLFYFLSKKQEKQNLSKKQLQEIDENFLAFKLTPKREKYQLLLKTINHTKHSISNNCLSYESNEKTHAIIIATHLEKISNSDLINLLDESIDKNYDVIEIICNEFDSNTNLKIFKNIEIVLINKTKLYNEYFLKNKTFPNKQNINTNLTKFNFKDFLRNFFKPQKSKSYFLCGSILIFSSLILPYHTYYIIVGSMLLFFSIICKLQPKIISN